MALTLTCTSATADSQRLGAHRTQAVTSTSSLAAAGCCRAQTARCHWLRTTTAPCACIRTHCRSWKTLSTQGHMEQQQQQQVGAGVARAVFRVVAGVRVVPGVSVVAAFSVVAAAAVVMTMMMMALLMSPGTRLASEQTF